MTTGPGSPITDHPVPRHVPACLLTRRQWLVTRLTVRKDTDPAISKNWTKPPYRASDGELVGDSWHPSEDDLSSVEEAIAALDRLRFEHLGFNLSGVPYLVSDLDHCFTEKGGNELKPWAAQYIDVCQSFIFYAERSPSGDGLHLWHDLRGLPKNPGDTKKEVRYEDGKIEFFSQNYVTVTGDAWGDFRGAPLDKQTYEHLRSFFYGGKTKPSESTESPSHLKADQRFALLLNGKIVEAGFTDPTGDSEADMYFVGHLAKKGLSRDAIQTLWKASGLRREKLERTDYVKKTLDMAFEGVKPAAADHQERELLVTRGDQVKPRKQAWLWELHLPLGETVGWFGNSGEAKTPSTTDIAARVTRGSPWPDGTPSAGPRSVVMMNAEDPFETKILPRFLAADGDPAKLYYVKGSVTKGSGSLRADLTDLARDLQALCDLIETIADVALVIIDPVTNHLGRAKYTDHQQVRSVLTPLAELAERKNFCVVLVSHLNRSERGTLAQFRTLGAGFYQVCRLVWLLGPDPEADPASDPIAKYRHVMMEDRNKEAPSWRYHTEKVKLELQGEEFEAIRVFWDGNIEVQSEEVVDTSSSEEKSEYARLARSLKKILDIPGGEKAASACMTELLTEFPEIKDKVNWNRLRKRAGVQTRKNGQSNIWFLETEKPLF